MICAIDPGLSGALAWLDDAGKLHAVHDMPCIEAKVGTTKRRRVSAGILASLFRQLPASVVVIEEVASQPTDGAVAAFSFGRSFGTLEGVAAGLLVPTVYVRPPVWKRDMRLSQDKDQARTMAIQLWPERAGDFARKKDDGRAEAALLALWQHKRGPV